MLSAYVKPVVSALFAFPVIAFLFTLPYIIFCYRKYGSLIFIRVLVVYSFILYMICAYFLVILPLPDKDVVALLTTPRAQLIPFCCIYDIFKEFVKYRSLFNRALIQMTFNIVLTIPFGIYLKYYFGCSKNKIIILSFCLSLFYELTQLSGLYFIYERGYRLFDIDDLILNTLGGLVGYYAAKPLEKIMPTRKQIDAKSLKEGVKVSFIRRCVQIGLDFIIGESICLAIEKLCALLNIETEINHVIIMFIYLVLFCSIGRCRSIGMLLTSTRLVDFDDNKPSFLKITVRYLAMIMIFYGIPELIIIGLKALESNGIINESLRFTLYIPVTVFWAFVFFYSFIELLKRKTLVYEGFSRTRIVTDSRLKKEKKL